MAGYTEVELAERAGAPVEDVRRMAELGLLTPAEDGFRPADIQRVRVTEALRSSGVSFDSLRKAVDDGHLSFAFIDLLFPEPVSYTDQTYGEAAAHHGMLPAEVQLFHEAVGLPVPEMDDRVRDDDIAMFPMGQMVKGLGMDPAVIARVLRVYGENMRRLAQAEPQFFHAYIEEPMLSSGMSEAQMRDMATQMSEPLMHQTEDMILWLYRRHREHFIMEHLVEHAEVALEQAGVTQPRDAKPPAIAFLDLVGYTRLTEEQGDDAAAELAASLGAFVQRQSRRHGGRPVKWLGDGVMFYFPSAQDGVRCALEMVREAPSAGLPQAHVGVNAGSVVFRDGDYFGRTVNIAARIAGQAGAGQVLVSEDIVRLGEPEGVSYRELGAFALKGLARPATLYAADGGPP
jgi:adenylate cyclase